MAHIYSVKTVAHATGLSRARIYKLMPPCEGSTDKNPSGPKLREASRAELVAAGLNPDYLPRGRRFVSEEALREYADYRAKAGLPPIEGLDALLPVGSAAG